MSEIKTITRDIDGVKVTANGEKGIEFVDLYEKIVRDMREEKRLWIRDLRARGIKAAHPDDGWVDRKRDIVQFVYPQFIDSAKVGDIVALGDSEKYRLVRLTEHLPISWVYSGRDPMRFTFIEI